MNGMSIYRNISLVIGLILFGVICVISLFAVSGSFVNEEVTPKWFGAIIAVSFAGILWNILYKKIDVPTQPAFLLAALCLILVLFRDGYVSGFNYGLLIYTGGLLLMLYLFMQMTKTCPATYLFGVITIYAMSVCNKKQKNINAV